jgi:hypothetical protein
MSCRFLTIQRRNDRRFQVERGQTPEDGDGAILRFFNTTERPVRGRVNRTGMPSASFTTNLNEDELEELRSS